MKNEWRKEKTHRHIGYRSKPVKKNISSNVSCTQLQARTPLPLRTGVTSPNWLAFKDLESPLSIAILAVFQNDASQSLMMASSTGVSPTTLVARVFPSVGCSMNYHHERSALAGPEHSAAVCF